MYETNLADLPTELQPLRLRTTFRQSRIIRKVFNPSAATVKADDRPILTGKAIISLMRKHHVTIRELAKRMQISQVRIRTIRERGMYCHLSARDWLQAITGADPGPLSFVTVCGLPGRWETWHDAWHEFWNGKAQASQ